MKGKLYKTGLLDCINNSWKEECSPYLVCDSRVIKKQRPFLDAVFCVLYNYLCLLYGFGAFYLPNDHYNLTLDFQRAGIIDHDRVHRGVGGLQTHTPVFFVEIL